MSATTREHPGCSRPGAGETAQSGTNGSVDAAGALPAPRLRSRLAAAGAALLGAAFIAGALVGESRTAGPAQVAGACIALQHSLRRGDINAQNVDGVLRELVGPDGEFRRHFSVSLPQFRMLCSEISRLSFGFDFARRDAETVMTGD